MRILDRYIVRQVVTPFLLGLLILTFLFIVPPLREYAEPLMARGVSSVVVLQLIAMLLPGQLALTIPLSLLLALLIAFGRLSSDREFVAMQACGISLVRLLRPVGLVAVVAWGATSYMWLSGMQRGNQAFRELTFRILADRAEGQVKPRVFFADFPGFVLFVREVPAAGGWNGVFLYDGRTPGEPAVYLARRGRVLVDRGARTVELVLEEGSRHSTGPAGRYEVFEFPERLILTLDPGLMFGERDGGPGKGINEMTVAELERLVAEREAAGEPAHNERIAIHWKYAIPVTCLIFGLIGIALGATNRRDGALGSFVLGVLVVFAYYVPLVLGPSMAKGQAIPPWLAAWLPNLVLGALGLALFRWRGRVADQPIRLPVPTRWRRPAAGRARRHAGTASHGYLRIMDRYIGGMYLRILLLAAAALLTVSYVATFVDHSDKLFKGSATLGMLLGYMVNATPQYVYWALPLSVLLAALVTVALLTKNSELVVMKACGISLYRIAMPMLAAAVVAGCALFAIEETVLGPANRRAEQIRHVMNGGAPDTFGILTRQWVAGTDGRIYHYSGFDPDARSFSGLHVYEFAPSGDRLARWTFAAHAAQAGDGDATWTAADGWVRSFDRPGGEHYLPFARRMLALEPAGYFATDRPDPRFMGYRQLRSYTAQLEAGGVDVLSQRVSLARKVAFPFVTIVLTLLAVPFAVTVGRSGAMAGLGVGIALAIAYWLLQSVFVAFGEGGLLAPVLAAWAPNLLFGAGATYLLLTVRT